MRFDYAILEGVLWYIHTPLPYGIRVSEMYDPAVFLSFIPQTSASVVRRSKIRSGRGYPQAGIIKLSSGVFDRATPAFQGSGAHPRIYFMFLYWRVSLPSLTPIQACVYPQSVPPFATLVMFTTGLQVRVAQERLSRQPDAGCLVMNNHS